MHISEELRQLKLQRLVAAEGFESVEVLCQETIADSVSPAICIDPECNYTTDAIEQDQDAGYCESCGQNTVVSALVLAGLI